MHHKQKRDYYGLSATNKRTLIFFKKHSRTLERDHQTFTPSLKNRRCARFKQQKTIEIVGCDTEEIKTEKGYEKEDSQAKKRLSWVFNNERGNINCLSKIPRRTLEPDRQAFTLPENIRWARFKQQKTIGSERGDAEELKNEKRYEKEEVRCIASTREDINGISTKNERT